MRRFSASHPGMSSEGRGDGHFGTRKEPAHAPGMGEPLLSGESFKALKVFKASKALDVPLLYQYLASVHNVDAALHLVEAHACDVVDFGLAFFLLKRGNAVYQVNGIAGVQQYDSIVR